MPFDIWWCFFITPQGLVCHFFPILPLSCLKINGCTNFCIALDFFKILMKKSSSVDGGKSLLWNELTWNHKTNEWLIILYDQECCQNNPLLFPHPGEERQLSVWTFSLWVGKDIKSHWWERWKMHLSSSEALHSKYNKMIFFILLISCCCDAMQTSVFSTCHFQRKVICQIILVQPW